MKFVIKSENHIIGMSGHITNDIGNDFDKYVRRFGFNDSESARETAECLGITNAVIIAIK